MMNLYKSTKLQTPIEESANFLTHLIGAIISMVGLCFLMIKSIQHSAPCSIISSSLFGGSMILMFMASMLYHLATTPSLKKRLKIFDHSTIFLLIAGSYTPFLLITLHSTFSYMLLTAIWLIAIIGISYKLFFVYHFPKLSTICYLIMGWLSLIAIKPLHQALLPQGLNWLIYGGACYSIGVIFYLWKRLLFSHAVWHLFVIAGCACHFIAIFYYVI